MLVMHKHQIFRKKLIPGIALKARLPTDDISSGCVGSMQRRTSLPPEREDRRRRVPMHPGLRIRDGPKENGKFPCHDDIILSLNNITL